MDMDFLAGNYLHGDLPLNKEYLLHYFKGDVEKIFLSYYFIFPSLYVKGEFINFYISFCDHTGFGCSTRWVRKLLVKVCKIEKALLDAESNFDINRVGEIKSGKAKF
jgi:hypothetical protein